MIYYYSGTGNTRYAARILGEALHERLYFLPDGETPPLQESESIGFMFPIYSWSVPPIVMAFLDRMGGEVLRGRYVWAVCTCGDETGIAMRLFAHKVKQMRGKAPEALFSVIMPNDYVLLPGFDVDPPRVAEAKLEAAPERLAEIARLLGKRETGVIDVHEGSFPMLRTRLVYPLFVRWGINPGKWKAGSECISCGRCERACPVHNIEMRGGRPRWGGNCLSCCGCYHVCPVGTISYGNATRGKGQYYLH